MVPFDKLRPGSPEPPMDSGPVHHERFGARSELLELGLRAERRVDPMHICLLILRGGRSAGLGDAA